MIKGAAPMETTSEMTDQHLRQLIDRRLEALVDEEMARLAFLGTGDRALTAAPLAAFLRGGGKRLRPALVYWGHRAAGGSPADEEAVLMAGCAVELLHACALILDDVMDESPLRRGRRTLHLTLADRHHAMGWAGDPHRFGEATATLVGMLAFTWADSALLRTGTRLAPALEVFTQLRVEVIGGQLLDLAGAAQGSLTAEEARRIAIYKSAKYTVERPLHLGHAIAGGSPESRAALSAYALPLGEAFQLRDDILGVFGDPIATGKPVGDDLSQLKQTALLVETRDRIGEEEFAALQKCDLATARDVVAGCGALTEIEERIAVLTGRALAALAAVPDERSVRALARIAAQATVREV